MAAGRRPKARWRQVSGSGEVCLFSAADVGRHRVHSRMGCGALRTYRTTRTCVETGPINDTPEKSPVLSRQTSGSSKDSEREDGVASLSPSPSVHSEITSITSGTTTQSQAIHRRYFKGASDYDLRSDVPTIAESIADMQDFQDLPMNLTRSGSVGSTYSRDYDFSVRNLVSLGSSHSLDLPHGARTPQSIMSQDVSPERQRSGGGHSGNNSFVIHSGNNSFVSSDDYVVQSLSMPVMSSPRMCQGSPQFSGSHSLGPINIDCRQHPLAVTFDFDKQSKEGGQSCAQSCNPGNASDIGACSDVPSVRDDMSVTSAPSEICVSFPPSVYHSETGTLTPTKARMQSLSNSHYHGSKKVRRPSLNSAGGVTTVPESENPLLSLMCEAGWNQDLQASDGFLDLMCAAGSTRNLEGPGSDARETDATETPCEGATPRSITPTPSASSGAPATLTLGRSTQQHRSDPGPSVPRKPLSPEPLSPVASHVDGADEL